MQPTNILELMKIYLADFRWCKKLKRDSVQHSILFNRSKHLLMFSPTFCRTDPVIRQKKISNLELLLELRDRDGHANYQSLDAALHFFCSTSCNRTRSLVKAHTVMKVFPLIENIRVQLTPPTSSICQQTSCEAPHELTRPLALSTLNVPNEIKYHDIWPSACIFTLTCPHVI